MLAVLLLCACGDDGPRGDADVDADLDAASDGSADGGPCPADAGPGPDAGEIDICACIRDTFVYECRAAPSVSCTAPADCCDDASPIPCGSFGNRFACDGGFCVPEGCTSHSECPTWAEATGLPDADAYGCLDPICGVGTLYCGLGARECETVDDCCLDESAIPCGVWGNRWTCQNGRCSTGECDCDGDCVEHALALGLPDAGDWACVAPLCSEFRTCAPRRGCSGPDDCCEAGSPVPCGTYGNRWACHRGQCFEEGCDDDAECAEYASASGLPDPGGWACPR